MLKAYHYRIYPDIQQQVLLNKHFGCARFVYNWALNLKNESYVKDKKKLSYFDLTACLPKLKQEHEWLKEINSQSLQSSLRNLDVAFTNFFKKIGKVGFPKFKSKRNKQSFQCPQHVQVDFNNNTIKLPKISDIKAKLSRKFEGKIKTTTISKTPSNKYFVSILIDDSKELPIKVEINQETSVGIDLGLKEFCITSNGQKFKNPKFYENKQKQLTKLQRRLAKKKLGSKNRNKARIKLAKIYETIENCRNDFLHKLSTKLVRENQTICIEDLNVKGMMKNHCLAKSIESVSWSKFTNFLQYKCDWYGKNLIRIGRFEPSTKMCSNCGLINNNLTLKDRVWKCSCGINHDRDINAARNIKTFALDEQNLIEQIGLDKPESTLVETEPLISSNRN